MPRNADLCAYDLKRFFDKQPVNAKFRAASLAKKLPWNTQQIASVLLHAPFVTRTEYHGHVYYNRKEGSTMALTPEQQIGSIRNQMEGMSDEDIQTIIRCASQITSGRKNRRRKELWGNVVAAIIKYQDEMNEQIDIIGGGDRLVPYPGRETIGALETI